MNNVRDISWTLTNGSLYKAVHLALERDDLASLKQAIQQVYPLPHVADRIWTNKVKPILEDHNG